MNQDSEIKNVALDELFKKAAKLKPRTEQEILKDFKKLGYKVKENTDNVLVLTTKDNHTFLMISKHFKQYELEYTFCHQACASLWISLEEHKLLHELFACWGWL